MNVRILKLENEEWIAAQIRDGKKMVLPSMHEGWRFNFSRHAKGKGIHAYVLTTEETPNIIEGCLIYKMLNKVEPYMAYIEIAPHNKGLHKKYDHVAGCLIAYASRLSFTLGQGAFKGWLAFDVQEPTKADQSKLMTLYSVKYRAKKFDETTMLIAPEDGEELIEKYLGGSSR